MYCKNCGKEIDDNAYVCPNCGVKVESESNVVKADADSGSKAGWGVLSFFIPLVGLILFLMWKNERPQTSKVCGICALVSFIFSVVLCIVYGIIVGSMLGSMLNTLSVSILK